MASKELGDDLKPKRIVDYVVVMGLSEADKGANLKAVKENKERQNSALVRSINEIRVLYAREELPDGYEYVTFADSDSPANFNTGSMGSEIFLCYNRGNLVDKTNAITGLDIIFTDKGERPPKGYTKLDRNLNKGSFGRTVYLCIERDTHKQPITDLVLVDETKEERCPAEFTKIDKSVNTGSFGHILHLCFKRTRSHWLHSFYTAKLLSRFPEHDHVGGPLPEEGLPVMCFPQGMVLRDKLELPQFFSFVLTGATGEELYCATLKFYEPLPAYARKRLLKVFPDFDVVKDEDGKQRRRKQLFVPKCVCLISHWPFIEAFSTFLKHVYQVSLSPSSVPIERYFGHFITQTKVPVAGGPAVLYSLGLQTIRFARPLPYFLPVKDFSFRTLFECLDINNVLTLFCHVLAERKIILYSNNYSVLAPVAESLRTLIFPLQWQFNFIPVLPHQLSYALRSPVPLIVGMHRTFLDEVRVSDDLVLVDLDLNRIKVPTHHTRKQSTFDEDSFGMESSQTCFLPQGLRDDLHAQLTQCADVYQERDTSMQTDSIFLSPQVRELQDDNAEAEKKLDEREVQDVFLRLFVFILQDYRDYLLPVTKEHTSTRIPFETKEFVSSFPDDMKPFMETLCETQAFATFIIDRSLPCTSQTRGKELLFFDWCIAIECTKGLDPDYYFKLEDLLTGKSQRPRVIPSLVEPEAVSPSHGQAYTYDTFPVLDPHAFGIEPDDPVWGKPIQKSGLVKSSSSRSLLATTDPQSYFEEELKKKIEQGVWRVTESVLTLRYRRLKERERDAKARRVSRADTLQAAGRSSPQPQSQSQPRTKTHRRSSSHSGATVSGGTRHAAMQTYGNLQDYVELPDDLSEPATSGSFSWHKVQLMTVYETWFELFLHEPHRENACVARKDLLQALIHVGKIVQYGLDPSARIFLSLCTFCSAYKLQDEFNLIYRSMTAFFPQQHPPVGFYFQCVSAESGLGGVDISGSTNIEPPSEDSRSIKAKYKLPKTLMATARCGRCSFEMNAELTVFSFLYQDELLTKTTKKGPKPPHPYQMLLSMLYGQNKSRQTFTRDTSNLHLSPIDSPRSRGHSRSPSMDHDSDGSVSSRITRSPGKFTSAHFDEQLTQCFRCHSSTNQPVLFVRFAKSSDPADEKAVDGGDAKHVLINPKILRDGLASKRKSYRQMLHRRREKWLKRAAEQLEDGGTPVALKPDARSLKYLSVLQWLRCEPGLFWNVFYYFAGLGLPYAFLYEDRASTNKLPLKFEPPPASPAVSPNRHAPIRISIDDTAVPIGSHQRSASTGDQLQLFNKKIEQVSNFLLSKYPSYILHNDLLETWVVQPAEEQVPPQTDVPKTKHRRRIRRRGQSGSPSPAGSPRHPKSLSPNSAKYCRQLVVLCHRMSSPDIDDKHLLSLLENVRSILAEPFQDGDANSKKPKLSNLQHLGTVPVIDEVGYKLLVALSEVLTRYTYTSHSKSTGSTSARTSAPRVVGSLIKLLCVLSGVEPRYSLLRNRGESNASLMQHYKEGGSPMQHHPDTSHADIMAVPGIRRAKSDPKMQATTTENPSEARSDHEAVVSLLTGLVSAISLYKNTKLIVQAGTLIIANQFLVLSNAQNQSARVDLFLNSNGLQVLFDAAKRHSTSPQVLDMCCYTLSVMVKLVPDTINTIVDTGGIPLVLASYSLGARLWNTDLLDTTSQILLAVSTYTSKNREPNVYLPLLVELGIVKVFVQILYKIVYAAENAELGPSSQHLDLIGECFQILELIVQSVANVPILVEEGLVKAIGVVLKHYKESRISKSRSQDSLGSPEKAESPPASAEKEKPTVLSPNQRAMIQGRPDGASIMNRLSPLQKLELDSCALRLLARMMSFPMQKIVKRVGGLVSKEEGVGVIVEAGTQLLPGHKDALLASFRLWLESAKEKQRQATEEEAKKAEEAKATPKRRRGTHVSHPSWSLNAGSVPYSPRSPRSASPSTPTTQKSKAFTFQAPTSPRRSSYFKGTPTTPSPLPPSKLSTGEELTSDDVHFDFFQALIAFALNFSSNINTDMLGNANRVTVRVMKNFAAFLSSLIETHRKDTSSLVTVDSVDADKEALALGLLPKPSMQLISFSLFPDSFPDLLSRAVIGLTNILQALDGIYESKAISKSSTGASLAGRSQDIAETTLPLSSISRDRIVADSKSRIGHRRSLSDFDLQGSELDNKAQALQLPRRLRKMGSTVSYDNLVNSYHQLRAKLLQGIADLAKKTDTSAKTGTASLTFAKKHPAEVRYERALVFFRSKFGSHLKKPESEHKANRVIKRAASDTSLISSHSRRSQASTKSSDNGDEDSDTLPRVNLRIYSRINFAKVLTNHDNADDSQRRAIREVQNRSRLMKSHTVSNLNIRNVGLVSSTSTPHLQKFTSSRSVGNFATIMEGDNPHHERSDSLTSTSSFQSGVSAISDASASPEEIEWKRVLIEAESSFADGRYPSLEAALRSHHEVAAMIRKGIPERLRHHVWLILTGGHDMRAEHPVDFYDRLAMSYADHGSACKAEIFQDLHRTLPDASDMFHSAEGKERLERVLGVYSLMDPDVVGYCQSMNIVAGGFLHTVDEDAAFWMLAAFIKRHVGYYTKTMCSLMVDQRVLEDLFTFTQPQLKDYMGSFDVKMSMFTVSWFLCLFTEAPLPLADIDRFYDHFFFYGDEVLFATALKILELKAQQIMKIDDLSVMLDFCLHSGMRTDLSVDNILDSLSLGSGLMQKVETLRRFHQTEVLRENHTVDHGFAMSLVTRFGFDNEQEIQDVWASFLSPSPWEILNLASIEDVLMFHQAFCPHVFSPEHRSKWRDHGLFSGVIDRLFQVLDHYNTGRVTLNDFVRGVSVFKKAPIEERQKLCFDFFDTDQSGIIDREKVTTSFAMFHSMYCGNNLLQKEDSDRMTKDIFEKASLVLADEITNTQFTEVISCNVYVKLFFRLDSDAALKKLLSQV